MLDIAAILFTTIVLGALALYQNHRHEKTMSNLANLATILDGVVTRLEKAIQEIRDATANTPLPPDAVTALAKLDAVAKALDDLNPDHPAEPVEPS